MIYYRQRRNGEIVEISEYIFTGGMTSSNAVVFSDDDKLKCIIHSGVQMDPGDASMMLFSYRDDRDILLRTVRHYMACTAQGLEPGFTLFLALTERIGQRYPELGMSAEHVEPISDAALRTLIEQETGVQMEMIRIISRWDHDHFSINPEGFMRMAEVLMTQNLIIHALVRILNE